MMGFMNDWTGMGWAWMLFGWVWMVAFWGVIIALVVWAVRRLSEPRQAAGGPGPLEILKARYARGEISKQQFDEMKRDLL